jgi:hypothetical protein
MVGSLSMFGGPAAGKVGGAVKQGVFAADQALVNEAKMIGGAIKEKLPTVKVEMQKQLEAKKAPELTQNIEQLQQQFEQQKTLQMVNEADGLDDSEKMTKLNVMMRKLLEVTVSAMSHSIIEIRTTDSIVSERKHIDEYLTNCDRTIFNAVRDHVVELREKSELKPLDLTCSACQHKYQQSFTLDMASFFAAAS